MLVSNGSNSIGRAAFNRRPFILFLILGFRDFEICCSFVDLINGYMTKSRHFISDFGI